MRSGGRQFSNTVGSYASGKNPRVKTFSRLVFPGQKLIVNLDKERGWGRTTSSVSEDDNLSSNYTHEREGGRGGYRRRVSFVRLGRRVPLWRWMMGAV